MATKPDGNRLPKYATPEQAEKWLDRRNREVYKEQRATQADHEELCKAVEKAVKEARK